VEIKKNKSTQAVSKEEQQKIFLQFLKNYVIDRNEKENREMEVLIEKIKYHTKGKEVVIENKAL